MKKDTLLPIFGQKINVSCYSPYSHARACCGYFDASVSLFSEIECWSPPTVFHEITCKKSSCKKVAKNAIFWPFLTYFAWEFSNSSWSGSHPSQSLSALYLLQPPVTLHIALTNSHSLYARVTPHAPLHRSLFRVNFLKILILSPDRDSVRSLRRIPYYPYSGKKSTFRVTLRTASHVHATAVLMRSLVFSPKLTGGPHQPFLLKSLVKKPPEKKLPKMPIFDPFWPIWLGDSAILAGLDLTLPSLSVHYTFYSRL